VSRSRRGGEKTVPTDVKTTRSKINLFAPLKVARRYEWNRATTLTTLRRGGEREDFRSRKGVSMRFVLLKTIASSRPKVSPKRTLCALWGRRKLHLTAKGVERFQKKEKTDPILNAIKNDTIAQGAPPRQRAELSIGEAVRFGMWGTAPGDCSVRVGSRNISGVAGR